MACLTNSANNSGLATCIELNIHIHLSQPLDTGSHFWSDDGCHGSFVEKKEKDALNYHAWPGPFYSHFSVTVLPIPKWQGAYHIAWWHVDKYMLT